MRLMIRWSILALLGLVMLAHVPLALQAQGALPSRTPLPTLTPSATLNLGPQPTAPASPTLASSATAVPLQPSPTSPLLVMSPTPNVSPQPTEPIVLPGSPPPLTISLPGGWQVGYEMVPLRTTLAETMMSIAVYRGPLQGGTATILILWGFPSIAPPPTDVPLPGTPTAASDASGMDLISQMLWTDGLRLLQGTVVDITCNVGTAGVRNFTVGGVQGVGTYFNINQCQNEPDTAGWFAGVNPYGRSYLFYIYMEPITTYNDARGDMQKLLDTVVFQQPTPITVTPTATPGP
jgi:hypothetical protein